jgi:hypothetical protein
MFVDDWTELGPKIKLEVLELHCKDLSDTMQQRILAGVEPGLLPLPPPLEVRPQSELSISTGRRIRAAVTGAPGKRDWCQGSVSIWTGLRRGKEEGREVGRRAEASD